MKFHGILFATTMLVAPAAAFAQATPAEDESGDIVVTAQNRSENVQDVPIAISVLAGEELVEAGVTDLTAVQRLAPALNIVNDTVQTRITIRGVGSNSNDESQDQAVAVNIDGEYLNRPTVLNASLFDLERVEVLRGPQGTLYGRNATGGAINFITRRPGDDFGFNASFSYGNYNQVIAEAGVDVPLGDIGGIRLAGIYANRDGWVFHPNVNGRSGDENTWSGRATLLLEPADALTIQAAVERTESDTVVASQAFFNFNAPGNAPAADCSTPGWVELAPLIAGGQCIPVRTSNLSNVNRARYDSPATGLSDVNQESMAYRGRVAYDFGGVTLTYTGGYRDTDRTSAVTLSPAYRFNTFRDQVQTQSHELRLNGETGIFVWQFGAFYFAEDLLVERGLYRAPPPPFLLGPNGGYVNYFNRDVRSRSQAVFGQTDINLSEQFTVVLGARYTDDRRRADYRDWGGAIANPASPLFNTGSVRLTNPGTPLRDLDLGVDDSKFTWLIGLNYTPNSDTLIYGRVSTGYKAGGFDSIGAYRPESNTAYEFGAKLNFGDRGQHIFNVAGFYYDYTDLQVGVLLDTTVGSQVFNAGGATVWGVEADARIRLSDRDTFTGSVNYTRANYDSLIVAYPVFCVGCGLTAVGDLDPAPGVVSPPNVDGNRPPYTPAWTITLGYEHEFELGSAGSLTANLLTTFKSSYFTDFFNFNDSRQQGFSQTDFSLTYRPVNERVSLQAFVRNIEDTRPLVYAGFTSAGADDIFNWQFGAPRTYGIRASVEF